MISEQDKQAILNGAYCTTRGGQKVKLLAQAQHGGYVFGLFKGDFICLNEDDSFCFFVNRNFEYLGMQTHKLDIIGLWQDSSEPFDLERALKGECINYGGVPCYIYYSNRKTETHEYIVEAISGVFTLGGVHEDELSKCIMWKEPEPQLSNNSLQLPKPITSFKDDYTIVYMLSAVAFTGKFKVAEVKTFNRDESMLNNGRYYNSKQDVIQVIEAITGKPYEDS